jgi:hypothetical protein
VSWDEPLAKDNTGLEELRTDHAIGSVFPMAETTVTYTATDKFGNEAQCSFAVSVRDCEPPEVECPSDTVKNANAHDSFGFVRIDGLKITDNFGIASMSQVLHRVDSPAGETLLEHEFKELDGHPEVFQHNLKHKFGIGTNKIIISATDSNGNRGECTVIVAIADKRALTSAGLRTPSLTWRRTLEAMRRDAIFRSPCWISSLPSCRAPTTSSRARTRAQSPRPWCSRPAPPPITPGM